VKADAARLVVIEVEKERLAADDARRVELSREATDIAERLALETNVEEMLTHVVAEATSPEG
jgi:hypothetical protein